MEKVLVDVLMAIYQNPDPLLYPNTEPEHTSVETKVGGHKFRYTVLLSLSPTLSLWPLVSKSRLKPARDSWSLPASQQLQQQQGKHLSLL